MNQGIWWAKFGPNTFLITRTGRKRRQDKSFLLCLYHQKHFSIFCQVSVYKNIKPTIKTILMDNLIPIIRNFSNGHQVSDWKKLAKNKTLQNLHWQLSYQILMGSLGGNRHVGLGYGQCKHDNETDYFPIFHSFFNQHVMFYK